MRIELTIEEFRALFVSEAQVCGRSYDGKCPDPLPEPVTEPETFQCVACKRVLNVSYRFGSFWSWDWKTRHGDACYPCYNQSEQIKYGWRYCHPNDEPRREHVQEQMIGAPRQQEGN